MSVGLFPEFGWVGGGGGGVGEVTLPSHPFCISACLPVMMMVEASMPLIEKNKGINIQWNFNISRRKLP